MPRDITVHFVGNSRDLAASSAVAEASVDRFGNATVKAGAEAEAASFGFDSLLLPLVLIAAALTAVLAPALVLTTTFAGLAAGIVALAAVTGNLGDVSGKAAATAEDLGAAQQKLTDAQTTAAIAQQKYSDTVNQYGASSDQAKQALISLHSAQQTAQQDQEKLSALQAQGQGPLAELIAKVRDMANALGQQAAPMAREFIGMLIALVPAVQGAGSAMIEWFAVRLPTMIPIVTQVVRVATGAVVGFFQAWGHMVDWFMAIWPAYTNAIMSVFNQIGTGIHFALPLLGLVHEAFVRLGPVIGFVRDHADSLKPVLYAVGVLFVAMAASVMLTVAAVLLVVAAIVAVAAAISWAVAHVYRIADAFWAVVHAAQAAAGAVGGLRDQIANLPVIGGALHAVGIPGFAEGGVVPGDLGAPMLAVVHGGETVVPPGRGGPGSTYNINVSVSPLASAADVGRQIVQAIQEYERRGSKGWRQ